MEVKAKFRNRIGIFCICALIGAVGAAALYYGIYFVLALLNYFDGFYKHDTFYTLYPTAFSYLVTFFTKGTLKHLPGHETELNWGVPLLFACGMVLLGVLLVILLRKNRLEIRSGEICGKGCLGKPFTLQRLREVKACALSGLVLKADEKRYLFLFLKNREEILEALTAIQIA